jgi:hypothetical protein
MDEPHLAFERVILFDALQRSFSQALARWALKVAEKVDANFRNDRPDGAPGRFGLRRCRGRTAKRYRDTQGERKPASREKFHNP